MEFAFWMFLGERFEISSCEDGEEAARLGRFRERSGETIGAHGGGSQLNRRQRSSLGARKASKSFLNSSVTDGGNTGTVRLWRDPSLWEVAEAMESETVLTALNSSSPQSAICVTHSTWNPAGVIIFPNDDLCMEMVLLVTRKARRLQVVQVIKTKLYKYH